LPALSIWVARAALLQLLLGFALGALALWNKGFALAAWPWRLVPAHVELLLLGWMAQLAVAVGYWILPRRAGQRPRAWLAMVAALLLNAGVGAVVLGALFGWPGAVALGRALELGAVVAFAAHAWPRVRAAGGT
jgi:hypothetical protein